MILMDPDNLFIQQDLPAIDIPIVMVMPKEPLSVSAHFLDLLKVSAGHSDQVL